jgi:hypothetical protein
MMSEPWTGLHNPARHEPHGGIADCIIESANPVMARWCTRDHPCRCCLAAEVAALRLERTALQEELDSAERGVTLLETKINAVREVCEDTWLLDARRPGR